MLPNHSSIDNGNLGIVGKGFVAAAQTFGLPKYPDTDPTPLYLKFLRLT